MSKPCKKNAKEIVCGAIRLELAKELESIPPGAERAGMELAIETVLMKLPMETLEQPQATKVVLATAYDLAGSRLMSEGETSGARAYFQEAMDLLTEIDTDSAQLNAMMASSARNMGLVELYCENYEMSVTFLGLALRLLQDIHAVKDDEDIVDPDVAQALFDLGTAQQSSGHLEEAANSYEDALNIWEDMYGSQIFHSRKKDTATNLCYSFLQEESLEESQADKLVENPEGQVEPTVDDLELIATCLSNLAFVYFSLGRPKPASNCMREALTVRLSVCDTDTADDRTAVFLHNYGMMAREIGEHALSLQVFKKELEIWRQIHKRNKTDIDSQLTTPDVHFNLATCLNDLGLAHQSSNDYESAVECHEEAIKIWDGVKDDDSSEQMIGVCYNNLGQAYKKLKHSETSLVYFQQALTQFKRIYGTGSAHPNISKTCSFIAHVYEDLGKLAIAMDYHHIALGQRYEFYGKTQNHVDVAASLTSIGYIHERKREMSKATEFYERAMHILLLLQGPDSMEVKDISERVELIYEQFNIRHKPAKKSVKHKNKKDFVQMSPSSSKHLALSPQRVTIWHKMKKSYFKCCILV